MKRQFMHYSQLVLRNIVFRVLLENSDDVIAGVGIGQSHAICSRSLQLKHPQASGLTLQVLLLHVLALHCLSFPIHFFSMLRTVVTGF